MDPSTRHAAGIPRGADPRRTSGHASRELSSRNRAGQEHGLVLAAKPEYANRTSYVIAPTGVIIYEYTAMNPDKHVENTMAAVEKWQTDHKKGA